MNQRKAFTLIELLVVIAIIAILMALLLPAIQKVREAANKMRCANNLKQFGVAIHAYHNDFGRLPPGGVLKQNNWTAFDGLNGRADGGSWLVHTLPYMEENVLYRFWEPFLDEDNVNLGIKQAPGWLYKPSPRYMHCPSDDWDHESFPSINYAGSLGPQCNFGLCGYNPFQWNHCEVAGPRTPPPGVPRSVNGGLVDTAPGGNDPPQPSDIRGCFNRKGVKIAFKDIKDGLTVTIMVGEVLPAEADTLEETQQANQGGWASINGGAAVFTTLPPINYRSDGGNCYLQGDTDPDHSKGNWNVSYGFKSRHPGGAQFLFADGSVHFLAEDIEAERLYQYLGDRNDGRHIEEIP